MSEPRARATRFESRCQGFFSLFQKQVPVDRSQRGLVAGQSAATTQATQALRTGSQRVPPAQSLSPRQATQICGDARQKGVAGVPPHGLALSGSQAAQSPDSHLVPAAQVDGTESSTQVEMQRPATQVWADGHWAAVRQATQRRAFVSQRGPPAAPPPLEQ